MLHSLPPLITLTILPRPSTLTIHLIPFPAIKSPTFSLLLSPSPLQAEIAHLKRELQADADSSERQRMIWQQRYARLHDHARRVEETLARRQQSAQVRGTAVLLWSESVDFESKATLEFLFSFEYSCTCGFPNKKSPFGSNTTRKCT